MFAQEICLSTNFTQNPKKPHFDSFNQFQHTSIFRIIVTKQIIARFNAEI